MSKIIEIPDMTEKQAAMFKTMLYDASNKHSESASNHHMLAMRAKTSDDVIWLERDAKELREYADLLQKIAASI